MKKIIVLCAAIVIILLGLCDVANASTDEEIFQRIQFLNQQIDEMTVNSVYSNVYTDSSWIDLSNISTTGSVTQYTYRNGNTVATINNFTTTPRDFDYAVDKIVRYILGNVANTYRSELFNTEITMITYQRTSIPVYVYGNYKTQAIDEIILGLPNCFDVTYDTSHGTSRPITPLPMPVMEKILGQFMLSKTSYDVNGETKIMDVAPEENEDKLFFPVRFMSYAFGVADEGIVWHPEISTVTIVKDKINISLTIGSKSMMVNDKEVVMDAAPYIKDGRTMLPPEPLADAFGITTTYNAETKTLTIMEQS